MSQSKESDNLKKPSLTSKTSDKSKPTGEPAKAGKRSAKAIRKAQEEAAKEERKQKSAEQSSKPKVEQKPPRGRIERVGKKYKEAYKQIDRQKIYSLPEAIDLAIKTSPSKFDATVEMHINLAIDPKNSDQNVRSTVILPHGSGKKLKVAVFAEGNDATKAKSAGADIVGSDQILEALDREQIDFDILISTPSLMPRLGKYAKLLGPKGLMPNPKSGTVTNDLVKAVNDAKAGRLEYRADQSGIVHLGIGRTSLGPQKLLENAQTVVTSVKSAKPASVKGTYIKSAFIATTMGPSIRTEI
jgi:large subunit ribosomal protein L1